MRTSSARSRGDFPSTCASTLNADQPTLRLCVMSYNMNARRSAFVWRPRRRLFRDLREDAMVSRGGASHSSCFRGKENLEPGGTGDHVYCMVSPVVSFASPAPRLSPFSTRLATVKMRMSSLVYHMLPFDSTGAPAAPTLPCRLDRLRLLVRLVFDAMPERRIDQPGTARIGRVFLRPRTHPFVPSGHLVSAGASGERFQT